jgi:hydroxyacylglutathione hydrolase
MEPFEDNPEDIIGKAQRGLELSDPTLTELLDLDRQQLRAARRGDFDHNFLARIAEPLKLSAAALVERLNGLQPPAPTLPPALHPIVTRWGDMRVNAWLLIADNGKEALLFDTGAEIAPLNTTLTRLSATITQLMLTHTHRDHIALLDELRETYAELKILSPEKEPIEHARPVKNGDINHWGGWRIEAIATPGHSIGGTSYALYPENQIDAKPIAVVVGDALFAGSIGGIRVSEPKQSLRQTYENALATIRTHLLCFSEETLLLPGHGPATTVGWEKAHNPFFAEIA